MSSTQTIEEVSESAPVHLEDIKVMVGGQGGDGTLTVINLLSHTYKQLGAYTYDTRNVLSRIRGGHADGVLRASVRPILSIGDGLDVLVAFDEEAVEVAKDQLLDHAVIIYDNSHSQLKTSLKPTIKVYSAKFGEVAGLELKKTLLKNTASFAFLCRVLGLADQLAEEAIMWRYSRRGGEVLESNMQALKIGFRLADQLGVKPRFSFPKGEPRLGLIQITGDEAIGMGFIVGGGRFYAGYPITPASEILEYLQANLPKFNGVAIQAEDEISAINMALGASLAGARAMVATSGPGQDLMAEGVGQAGMAELPLVIVEVQRAGPSTGMPTKHEQSDVNHVVFAGHGDFPRLVISPADASDCFYLTAHALNLAEKYQLPVFILIDQALGQNTQTVPEFDFSQIKIDRGKLLFPADLSKLSVYKRYEFTDDGVSPRTIPGTPDGFFQVTGNEHNEWGFVSVDRVNRTMIMRKRMLKVETAKKDMPRGRLYGDQNAKIGFISYGSNLGPILEAMDQLAEKGIKTKFLVLRSIYPLLEEVQQFLESVDTAFVVESNLTGQLSGLIKREYGYAEKIVGINKYDGSVFRPSEIVAQTLSRIFKNGGE
ncbi:MAG: 2-oxoacid:acceptor oxidoreductase subunit alpha [Thermoprotei archaeon]